MIYDSLDTLPLKLFLKILKLKDSSLLTDDPKLILKCPEIWKRLEEEFKELDPENKVDKILKTLIKVEKFKAQYNAIILSLKVLGFDRDLDLENLIRSQGFQLRELNYKEDLETVERDVEAIQLLIKEYSDKLPRKKEGSTEKASNIDEVILGYSSITGLQFDTNKITVSQFYALKNIFDQKVKHMEAQAEKTKNKSKKRK